MEVLEKAPAIKKYFEKKVLSVSGKLSLSIKYAEIFETCIKNIPSFQEDAENIKKEGL